MLNLREQFLVRRHDDPVILSLFQLQLVFGRLQHIDHRLVVRSVFEAQRPDVLEEKFELAGESLGDFMRLHISFDVFYHPEQVGSG